MPAVGGDALEAEVDAGEDVDAGVADGELD